ncbi:MAG: hypothetical protein U9R79_09665 [Armatimonadota bacterium]|nr:hypothetical protein [Armatimonadota bacterium]
MQPRSTYDNREEGLCPSCGAHVEVPLERVFEDADGHYVFRGKCPECEGDIISLFDEGCLEWMSVNRANERLRTWPIDKPGAWQLSA